MVVAVDKNNVGKIKKRKDTEYIYVFNEKEKLKNLLKLKMKCISKDYIEFVDINTTNYKIECRKKTNFDEEKWYELPPEKDIRFAIIIPNYNYEHTIEKCLNSIFNQTYQNFEIIFVDDVSTDNSVQIASKTYDNFLDKQTIDKEYGELKIIKLKQKRLNGGARNEAYLHLSDDVDYIYYVDSDDWLENEYVLEKFNKKLKYNKPDVLFVGMAKYKNNKQEICFTPEYKNKYEAFNGWSGSCGKVIKKELATRQECLYNEGTLKEDKNQHCRICFYMKSFDLLQEPVYVWNQQNYKSVTTIREKTVWGTSTIRHYADAKQFYLSVKGQDPIIDELMEQRLFLCKQELLSGGDKQW